MSMVRRTLRGSRQHNVATDTVTELFSRPQAVPRASAQGARRLPKLPPYTPPAEQVAWMRAAEAALRQKPRRARTLFSCVLIALILLDALAFGRMAGWWEPTEVLSPTCVPGVFVPITLRALSYGAPGAAPAAASHDVAAAVAAPRVHPSMLGAKRR